MFEYFGGFSNEVIKYWEFVRSYYTFRQFQSSAAFHIETNHLICTADQMTGFYLKYNTGLKLVKVLF